MSGIIRIAAAGLCLLTSVPAAAQEWSGYGEVQGGGGIYRTHQYYDGWAPAWFVGGSGHVNWNFAPGLNVQMDVEGRQEGLDAQPHDWSNRASKRARYGIGAHFDLIDPDYRFGLLGSLGKVDTGGHSGLFSAGIEGAAFFDRVTALAQIGYTQPVSHPDDGYRSGWLHTAVRWFVYDNVMLEAVGGGAELAGGSSPMHAVGEPYVNPNLPPSVGYIRQRFVASPYGPGEMLKWGLGGEYRFEDWPLGIGLSYRGSHATWRSGIQYYYLLSNGKFVGGCTDVGPTARFDHLFAIRLRWYVNSASLIANDRTGAGTADYNPWYGDDPVSEANFGAVPRPPAC